MNGVHRIRVGCVGSMRGVHRRDAGPADLGPATVVAMTGVHGHDTGDTKRCVAFIAERCGRGREAGRRSPHARATLAPS